MVRNASTKITLYEMLTQRRFRRGVKISEYIQLTKTKGLDRHRSLTSNITSNSKRLSWELNSVHTMYKNGPCVIDALSNEWNGRHNEVEELGVNAS